MIFVLAGVGRTAQCTSRTRRRVPIPDQAEGLPLYVV